MRSTIFWGRLRYGEGSELNHCENQNVRRTIIVIDPQSRIHSGQSYGFANTCSLARLIRKKKIVVKRRRRERRNSINFLDTLFEHAMNEEMTKESFDAYSTRRVCIDREDSVVQKNHNARGKI